MDLIGEWFAQIDIPQNDLTILLEFDFLNSDDCVVKCKWMSENRATKEESGKAKYIMTNNQLIITFLNEDELIRYDHVFMMKNVYDIKRENGRFVIVNNRMFRNVDVPFGKGYENRGFAKILF